VFFFHVVSINFVVVVSPRLIVLVAQVGNNRTMFFIILVVGFFFFLAYAHILCLVLDGFAHVVGGVG
jgi:hypothetical protein